MKITCELSRELNSNRLCKINSSKLDISGGVARKTGGPPPPTSPPWKYSGRQFFLYFFRLISFFKYFLKVNLKKIFKKGLHSGTEHGMFRSGFATIRAAGIERGVLRQWLYAWLAPKAMSVNIRLVNYLDSISTPHHNIFQARKCQF